MTWMGSSQAAEASPNAQPDLYCLQPTPCVDAFFFTQLDAEKHNY